MPIDTPQLATTLRSALARVAEPERAAPMQAYAKSALPFLGVTAVPLRRVCREVFAVLDLPTAAAWRQAVLGLWRGARYREERGRCAATSASTRRS